MSFELHQPVIYVCQFGNDFNKLFHWLDNSQKDQVRLTLSTLSLLALYQPITPYLTQGLNITRSVVQLFDNYKSYHTKDLGVSKHDMLRTCFSLSTIAMTIFNPTVGMFMTAAIDLVQDVRMLLLFKKNGYTALFKNQAAQIVKNALHLSLFITANPQILMASLAMHTLLGLYHGINALIEEFKKEPENRLGINYLQAASMLLVAAGRLYLHLPDIDFKKIGQDYTNFQIIKG